MPELSKDIIALLQYLLPGFLVAWVYYGVTSHPKPSQFERTIQALIFMLGVRALVFCERIGLETIGKWKSIRTWDSDADLISSLISAIFLGLFIAYVSNTDSFYKFLRDKGFSKRSGHPSEWCGAFSEFSRYVVLQLKDDRRLYGWPKVWPSDAKNGHFVITNPSWIDKHGKDHPLTSLEGLVINVEDVRWVEIMGNPEAANV